MAALAGLANWRRRYAVSKVGSTLRERVKMRCLDLSASESVAIASLLVG